MSSHIIYHHTVMRLPQAASGMPVDIYFWLWQIGSSNCYEMDHSRPGGVGRRSRSWSMASFGCRDQVLRTAIYFAGDCEGSMLKYKSASSGCKPETLIRSVRQLLIEADKMRDMPWAFKDQSLRFTLKSPTASAASETEKRYSIDEIGQFFADHPDWLSTRIANGSSFAKVYGPELR